MNVNTESEYLITAKIRIKILKHRISCKTIKKINYSLINCQLLQHTLAAKNVKVKKKN